MPNAASKTSTTTPEGTLDAVPRAVTWRVSDLVAGEKIPPHTHERAQLLYACEGVMTVTTARGIWVVPPHRAVWIPSGQPHAVQANSALSLRNLYFNMNGLIGMPDQLSVVAVPRLLRELILELVHLPALYDETGPGGRLIDVVLDRIRTLNVVPLFLPLPSGRLISKVTDAITCDPSDNRSMVQWAAFAGTSNRTLARLFTSETGMTFGQWRQQARLLEAMRMLADGQPVSTVALDLGYNTQSAFITMFRKALGKTPGRYFA